MLVSIRDRARFVADALKRRHRRLLQTPAWTPEELREVAPNLRASIQAALSAAAVVRARIGSARARGHA